MSPKWPQERLNELQEGIERIRRMSQRISEAHDLVAANNELLCRDRELVRSGPLHDSRDLRIHESQPRRAGDAGARRRSRSRR